MAKIEHGDKLWVVYQFEGAKGRFKSLAAEKDFKSLVKVIWGGLHSKDADFIYGIYSTEAEAKKAYDGLKLPVEEAKDPEAEKEVTAEDIAAIMAGAVVQGLEAVESITKQGKMSFVESMDFLSTSLNVLKGKGKESLKNALKGRK